MFKLARYLKLFKREVIFGPIFKLTEAVFEIIVPLVMASIIDKGIAGDGGRDYILKMGGVLVLLGALGLGFSLSCQYLASKASQGVGTAMRNDLFRHIQSLSHSEIDRFGTDSLTTRVINDVNQLQLATAMLIRLAVRVPFLIIGAAAMAVSIDRELSLVFFVASPIVALVLYLVMSRTVPLYGKIQKKLDGVSLIARESLAGARVIRAFSSRKREEKRFCDAANDLTAASIRAGRISALLSPATFLIMNCAVIAILYFGGVKVDTGSLTQGEVIALINYLSQITLAMVVLANLVIIFTKAAACAARVNEVFETAPSIENGEESIERTAGVPAVEFENVSFSYGGGETVLENISFTLMPGEVMGIIGGTGSGKSTLASLIPRFYDCQSGAVKVFAKDVRSYKTDELRRAVAVAQQSFAVIKGTIEDNIRMGRDYISREDIENAAKTAQAHEFISEKEKGYSSAVTRGGSNLSGGQKQRISIARALAGRPDVLILDDSASALDFATDAALRKALRRDVSNAAVIIISQRVSTVRSADKIAVMDDGKIVGIGSHDELLEACPIYAEICASQLKEEDR